MGRREILIGDPASHDSILVILPGSGTERQKLMFLCDLLEIDAYTARLKLSASIPVIIGSCHKNDILGPLGDKLETLGINFLAIDRLFFNAPFKTFDVTGCHFNQGLLQFENRQGEKKDIAYNAEVLILESRYRDEELKRKTDRRFIPLSPGVSGIETSSESSKKVQTEQVIHLYLKDSSVPFLFTDRNINYQTMGGVLAQSSSWNFRKLINTIEMFFEKQCDRTMVEHAFALNRSLISEIKDAEHTTKKHTQVYSNEDSANLMSRLLFCKWWRERRWTNRIMPGDEWV